MFKIWILAYGESTYATNGLDFPTIEEAQEYGHNLLSRWYGAEKFAVLPQDDKFIGHLDKDTVKNNAVGYVTL